MSIEYNRTNWQNDVTPLNQTNMNNIENGVANATSSVNELSSYVQEHIPTKVSQLQNDERYVRYDELRLTKSGNYAGGYITEERVFVCGLSPQQITFTEKDGVTGAVTGVTVVYPADESSIVTFLENGFTMHSTENGELNKNGKIYVWLAVAEGVSSLPPVSTGDDGKTMIVDDGKWVMTEVAGIGTVWGNISGSISNQSDLYNELSSKEDSSNKVTVVSSAGTDSQYPSAKATYDFVTAQIGGVAQLVYYAEYGVTPFSTVSSVLFDGSDGAIVFVKKDGCIYQSTSTTSSKIIFTSVSSGDTFKQLSLTSSGWADDGSASSDSVLICTPGVTTFSEIGDAVSSGKICLLKYSDSSDEHTMVLTLFNSNMGGARFTEVSSDGMRYWVLFDNTWDTDPTSINFEKTSNKVTSLSSSSTNTQYPSAKCVYDALAGKVSVAQGAGNVGKTLMVNASGDLELSASASSGMFVATYGTSTFTDVNSAYLNNLVPVFFYGMEEKIFVCTECDQGGFGATFRSGNAVVTLKASDSSWSAPTLDTTYVRTTQPSVNNGKFLGINSGAVIAVDAPTAIFTITRGSTTISQIQSALNSGKIPVMFGSSGDAGKIFYVQSIDNSSAVLSSGLSTVTVTAPNSYSNTVTASYQTTSNLVTSLSNLSTDTQYPSAKATYDFVDGNYVGKSNNAANSALITNGSGNVVSSSSYRVWEHTITLTKSGSTTIYLLVKSNRSTAYSSIADLSTIYNGSGITYDAYIQVGGSAPTQSTVWVNKVYGTLAGTISSNACFIFYHEFSDDGAMSATVNDKYEAIYGYSVSDSVSIID